MNQIATNIAKVKHRIQQAAEQSGRAMTEVTLLAVSKKHPAESIHDAHLHTGQQHFGENYAQELAQKHQILSLTQQLPLVWHFIGPIQSNKCAIISQCSDWVHSVDRQKVAHKLNETRAQLMANNPAIAPLNICLQINIDNEASKSGIALTELDSLAAEVITLPALKLRGLMAIPDPAQSAEHTAKQYQLLQTALSILQKKYPEQQLDTLSYGMSQDLEIAIANGATCVRIGTDIFGQRV